MTDQTTQPQTRGVDAAAAAALAQPGHPPALANVYQEHFSYVWHALRRLGVRSADVEDAAQEVFVVVHRKLAEFDPSRPLRPWLFGIAHRVAAGQRRRAHVTREVGETPMHLADAAPGPEMDAQTAQRRALLMRALDLLPFERRAVVVMHELHEHAIPEVADALGIPLNTAYSRLRLGRADLSAALKRLRGKEA